MNEKNNDLFITIGKLSADIRSIVYDAIDEYAKPLQATEKIRDKIAKINSNLDKIEGGGGAKMKIELSQEAIDIILTELDTARTRCGWELSKLPPYKTDSTEYTYWTQRQGTIEKALNELREIK